MIYSRKNVIGLFVVFLFVGCVTSKNNVKKSVAYNETFKEIAFEVFGKDTAYNFSPNKTYVLCTSKAISNSGINPNLTKEYLIVKIENAEIVYHQKLSNSDLFWKSDYEILINTQRGYIESPTDKGTISKVINLRDMK